MGEHGERGMGESGIKPVTFSDAVLKEESQDRRGR
jgi:hypothetical protein